MGTTSKPLHIAVEQSVYAANELGWLSLREQGHTIEVISTPPPDLYLAPYAMRLTPDMLLQLPTAFTLAMKGARALRHGPKGEITKRGTHAQEKKPRQRKHTTLKVKATPTGELPIETTDTGTGGATVSPVGTPPNYEGTNAVDGE